MLKYLFGLAAAIGLCIAVYAAWKGEKPRPVAPAAAPPAQSPYDSNVAGTGLIEAETQNVSIAPAVSGLVSSVAVQAGAQVRRGDLLFELENGPQQRQSELVKARLWQAQAARATAQAELARLQALPRPEDLPPAQARLRQMQALQQEAQAKTAQAQARLDLRRGVEDQRAVSRDELATLTHVLAAARAAELAAQAAVELATAELNRLKAGASSQDLDLARAAVQEAESAVAVATVEAAAAATELERRSVRSPMDGSVLQVQIRPGEYASSSGTRDLLLLGSVERLVLRVDVDENDAWRVQDGASASAQPRGGNGEVFELEWRHAEPFVIPKRSLTGDSTERVDTRVLQLLYTIKPGRTPLRVGQIMDVFIKVSPP